MSSQDANRDGALASAADTRAGLWAASGRRREREARGLNSSAAAAVLRRLWATGQRLFTTSWLYNVGAWPAERASNQGAELQSHSTQQAGAADRGRATRPARNGGGLARLVPLESDARQHVHRRDSCQGRVAGGCSGGCVKAICWRGREFEVGLRVFVCQESCGAAFCGQNRNFICLCVAIGPRRD